MDAVIRGGQGQGTLGAPTAGSPASEEVPGPHPAHLQSGRLCSLTSTAQRAAPAVEAVSVGDTGSFGSLIKGFRVSAHCEQKTGQASASRGTRNGSIKRRPGSPSPTEILALHVDALVSRDCLLQATSLVTTVEDR